MKYPQRIVHPLALACSLLLLAVTATVAVAETSAPVDEPVRVVGSRLLHAVAARVAEAVSAPPSAGTPGEQIIIEPIGTDAGIASFCGAEDGQRPAILTSGRRLRPDDIARCDRHGIDEVVEIKIGYDGVTLVQSPASPPLALRARDLYLALAARVPDPDDEQRLIANPYRTWHEVSPALPDLPIRVVGPPACSASGDAFAELALESGCISFEEPRRRAGRSRDELARLCRPIRRDGAFSAIDNIDSELLHLDAPSPRLAIVGYRDYLQHQADLRLVPFEGVTPDLLGIVTARYLLSRPLYVYAASAEVSRRDIVQRWIAELTSEAAWSFGGYLGATGLLVPMREAERRKYAYIARERIQPGCPPFCR